MVVDFGAKLDGKRVKATRMVETNRIKLQIGRAHV